MGGQATPTQLQAEAYKENVDPLQLEVTGLNNKLTQEQHSLRRQLEALEKNPEGLFSGQLQNEMQRVERDSLKTQADISVILAAKQGMLSDAQEIADRAVKAQTEYQQKRIDLLQMNYDRNKSLFDKDEQRAFESAQADRQRALDREEEQLKEVSDLSISALENGAPTSVVTAMRNAKDVTEALSIGGGYIGLLARQAAARSAANADLSRRKELYALAALGDKVAMEELGIDPNAPDAEQRVKSQDEIVRLDEEIARVEAMLGNNLGLQTASGAIRSPLTSSFFNPVGGVVFNYAKTRDAKADFLSKANYVLTNLTTEKVTELKDRGVAFTPMTDADIALIGRATGELEGYTIRDESNKVVGFTSETGARDALGQVVTILSNAKDKEYRKMITNSELSEIDGL
jgi:FtsZ-binding cell division protein ZapB